MTLTQHIALTLPNRPDTGNVQCGQLSLWCGRAVVDIVLSASFLHSRGSAVPVGYSLTPPPTLLVTKPHVPYLWDHRSNNSCYAAVMGLTG